MSHTRFAAAVVSALALVPAAAAAQSVPRPHAEPPPAPDPQLCPIIANGYAKNGFADWLDALDGCWKKGDTNWVDIFWCGFDQLPETHRYTCVKEALWQAGITHTTIADIIEFNSDAACPAVIDSYKSKGYGIWANTIRQCSAATSSTCLHDDIFECAWNRLPRVDQKPCLREHLAGAPLTAAVIGEVRGLCAIRDSVAANQEWRDFSGVGSELCELPQGDVVSTDNFAPKAPETVFDHDGSGRKIDRATGRNLGDNEGRLRPDLRQVAQLANPQDCSLPLSAYNFALAEATSDPLIKAELIITARAYADLSVTGRRAFDAFKKDLPGTTYCMNIASRTPAPGCFAFPTANLQPSKLIAGCNNALDRAYDVANYLRTGQAVVVSGPQYDAYGLRLPAVDRDRRRKDAARAALGWIAVSGEDDLPHRPVNVPSSDSPQFDLDVSVEAPFQLLGMEVPYPGMPVRVHARYVIAQSRGSSMTAATPGHWELVPDREPRIPWNSEVLLFIHGMDSRAEEAEDITRHLFARMAAIESARNLVIVTVDLPTSGYTEALDWKVISPLTAMGWPDGNTDFTFTGKTPMLDFLETFIVRFAETLDAQPRVEGSLLANVKAVMGGSLGGNLSFRLGRRPATPWLQNVVVWSPASVWLSMGEGAELTKHSGPRIAWFRANDRDPGDPDDLSAPRIGRRHDFFYKVWDDNESVFVSFLTQPQTWFSPNYQCWRAAINNARLDRHETYTARFLSWRWRLAAEQLLYSHSTMDTATGRARYMSNDKPMLLACGVRDDVNFNEICDATRTTADRMTFTPGRALYLKQTGHALDNERPRFWALQVQTFLGL